MKSLEQKIIVRCKNCGWRIFDKVTMTTGVIELKCPNWIMNKEERLWLLL